MHQPRCPQSEGLCWVAMPVVPHRQPLIRRNRPGHLKVAQPWYIGPRTITDEGNYMDLRGEDKSRVCQLSRNVRSYFVCFQNQVFAAPCFLPLLLVCGAGIM